jgi:hypothetical protein
MSCTARVLGIPWSHHAWRRRVTATSTVPTTITDMWGRDVDVEHVVCRTEEVCDACGAVRDTGYCQCDTARADACAVRLSMLRASGQAAR